MFCLSFILLSLTCACAHAQVLTSSTPSLTSTDITGVSCAVHGLSSYCIAGGACCLDSTCCGVGMLCVASTTTNGYDCEASNQSGSVGAPVAFSSIVFSSHAFSSFNMSVLRTLGENVTQYPFEPAVGIRTALQTIISAELVSRNSLAQPSG